MIVVGTDEAGRGPLAGSVFAAAVYIPSEFNNNKLLDRITDSKKLSQKDRFSLYNQIKDSSIKYKFSSRNSDFIDNHNILFSALDAMKESILNLIEDIDNSLLCKEEDILVKIDGNQDIKNLPFKTETVVKGDLLVKEISIASIIAKCEKDLEAIQIAKEYPEYGFEKHKGYGTRLHLEALKKYGPTKYHRKSFAGVKEFYFSKEIRELYNEIITSSSNNDLENIKFKIMFSSLEETVKNMLLKYITKRSKDL